MRGVAANSPKGSPFLRKRAKSSEQVHEIVRLGAGTPCSILCIDLHDIGNIMEEERQ